MYLRQRPVLNKRGEFFFRTGGVIVFLVLLFCMKAVCFPVGGICGELESRLDFTLPVPDNAVHKQMLGIETDRDFTLGQIRADLVIIEVFSMYCPICQKEAEDVNRLYRMIRENPDLNGRVKLIGIGAGNSPFEVGFFRKKYNIEFPLFSDADFTIHGKINEVRTPHFFGLRILGDDTFKVVYSRSGELVDPRQFLDTLLKLSKLDQTP